LLTITGEGQRVYRLLLSFAVREAAAANARSRAL
jgi:hypothetical protein